MKVSCHSLDCVLLLVELSVDKCTGLENETSRQKKKREGVAEKSKERRKERKKEFNCDRSSEAFRERHSP
jgi:hypothetical protein